MFYPSMQEIWPELYHTAAIRMVEVRFDVGGRKGKKGGAFHVCSELLILYQNSQKFLAK